MKFLAVIDLDSKVFKSVGSDLVSVEVAQMLRDLGEEIDGNYLTANVSCALTDASGNQVGHYTVVDNPADHLMRKELRERGGR